MLLGPARLVTNMRVTIRFADSVDKKGVKIPSHLDELSKRQRTDKSLI